MTDFKKGDKVKWDTPQGKTSGEVKKKITSTERVGNDGQKGTKVKGSKDDPRIKVESDSTGKEAAHKPESLEKKN